MEENMKENDIRHLIVKIVQLAKPMHYSNGEIMGYYFPQLSFGKVDINLLKRYVEELEGSKMSDIQKLLDRLPVMIGTQEHPYYLQIHVIPYTDDSRKYRARYYDRFNDPYFRYEDKEVLLDALYEVSDWLDNNKKEWVKA